MDVTSNDDPRRDAMLRRDSRTAAPGAKRTLVPRSARTTDRKEAVRAFMDKPIPPSWGSWSLSPGPANAVALYDDDHLI